MPLSSGVFFVPSYKLKLRIAVGAWLLAAFVLMSAYSSVLISFILAPQFKPLLENVKELGHRKDLLPATVKGNGPDAMIMVR